MNLGTLIDRLGEAPSAHVQFQLPTGEMIADHAHVTEVARIEKKFIDCGGTFRTESFCRLQTWTADDLAHRLSARTLLGILEKARPLSLSDDLEVDVEHEVTYISQFPLDDVRLIDGAIVLSLGLRHTACLAPEKCLPPEQKFVQVGRRS